MQPATNSIYSKEDPLITIKLIPNQYGDVIFAIEKKIIDELGWTFPCDVYIHPYKGPKPRNLLLSPVPEPEQQNDPDQSDFKPIADKL